MSNDTTNQRTGIIALVIIAMSILAVIAVNLTTGNDDDIIAQASNRPTTHNTRPRGSSTNDASARMACEHFRNVAADAVDGILTDQEFRTKIQEVDRDAAASENTTIRNAARSLLRDITAGRNIDTSVRSLGDACRRIGQ